MKKPILLTLLVSAGLVTGACGDKDNSGATATSPMTNAADDDGTGAMSADDDGTGAGPGDDGNMTSDGTGAMDETGADDSPPPPNDGFITENDFGGVSFECDLFTQDCPDGEKCMPWSNNGEPAWNATRCSPLSPNPQQNGDSCMVEGSGVSGIDNCDIALMCWNVDENGVGVCEDMCTGSADNPICEDPDDVCAQANGGAISLCLPSCDPISQDCVVSNEVCYPINDDWTCAPDASGEQGAFNDGCEYINACDPGNVCIGAAAFTNCPNALGCCSSVCNIMEPGANADCQALDAGMSCEAWYAEGAAPPGYENVGVCALPA